MTQLTLDSAESYVRDYFEQAPECGQCSITEREYLPSDIYGVECVRIRFELNNAGAYAFTIWEESATAGLQGEW